MTSGASSPIQPQLPPVFSGSPQGLGLPIPLQWASSSRRPGLHPRTPAGPLSQPHSGQTAGHVAGVLVLFTLSSGTETRATQEDR